MNRPQRIVLLLFLLQAGAIGRSTVSSLDLATGRRRTTEWLGLLPVWRTVREPPEARWAERILGPDVPPRWVFASVTRRGPWNAIIGCALPKNVVGLIHDADLPSPAREAMLREFHRELAALPRGENARDLMRSWTVRLYGEDAW